MLTSALVAVTRVDYLFDTTLPYKFSNARIAQLLSAAEREACKRADLILDKTTQTSGNVASGTSTTTTANKLTDATATFTDSMVGKTVYNTTDNTWAVITAKDSTTTLSIDTDVMVSGEAYVIGDSTKALTRVCIESGVSAYALSEKVIKVNKCYLDSRGKDYPLTAQLNIDSALTGTPTHYVEGRKLITVWPEPTETDTLNLEVYRYPINDLTTDTSASTGTATSTVASKLVDSAATFTNEVIGKILFNTTDKTYATVTARDTSTTLSLSGNIMASGEAYTIGDTSNDSTPEIDEEYHLDLCHYAAYIAFSKPDHETQDMPKAQWHEGQFALKFGSAKSAHDDTLLKMFPANFKIKQPGYGIF